MSQMNGWGAAAVIAGGLFAGGVLSFTWARLPLWREMDVSRFLWDFERTINKADRVQPTLLVVAIVSILMFARSLEGTARALMIASAIGFGITLLASVLVLVPLQRRMIKMGSEGASLIDTMRVKWFQGHLGRSVLSLVSLWLMAVGITA